MIPTPTEPFLPIRVRLANSIREFWTDTNTWIIALIRSILYGIPDREEIMDHLVKNAEEYASLLRQYYGEDVVGRLRGNYLRYIRNLEILIDAYKANNTVLIEQQRQILYGIGDELARILSGINKYWDMSLLQTMIFQIIHSTEQQIFDIIAGNYGKWIEDYEIFMKQVYRLSDEITYGILRQFPNNS